MNGDLYATGNFYGPNCTAADNCSEQVTVTTVVPGNAGADHGRECRRHAFGQ